MNSELITKLASTAASDCVKTADFGLINMLKSLLGSGGLDLKSLMPYMTGFTVPLAKGIGGVAGIPGIAGMLDLANGGENIAALTGYGNFSSAAPSAQGVATSAPKPAPPAAKPQQTGPIKPPNIAPSTPPSAPAPTPTATPKPKPLAPPLRSGAAIK